MTLSDIVTNVRYIIEDTSTSMVPGDIFTYAASAVFTLTESNIISVTAVFKNDVELESGEYTYDSDANQITVSASLTSGDTIEIQYTYYPDYSDTEIKNYIRSAVIHLSINNYYNWTIETETIYPEPSVSEKNLISMVTGLLIKPNNKTYRLPDMSIVAPKDLPTKDKISKTIAIFKKNTHGNFSLL